MAEEEVGNGKEGREKEGRARWWMTGGRRRRRGLQSSGGTRVLPEVGRGRVKKKAEEHEKKEEDEKKGEEVEEEYAAARKSRPIFQRGTIATERPGDHLKYLVAGRKLSGTGSR